MEPVQLPSSDPIKFDSGVVYETPGRPEPSYSFIKITGSFGSLTRSNIHIDLIHQLLDKEIHHAKIFHGIAIPIEGCALLEQYYEVVM